MQDIAEFLKDYDPFRELDRADLDRLAANVEVEFFPAGTTIFRQGERPQDEVHVVRRGAVELVDHGRVLDLLGEGELFGHPSMVSGLPTGFEVRAHEDTLCYALAAAGRAASAHRPHRPALPGRSLLGPAEAGPRRGRRRERVRPRPAAVPRADPRAADHLRAGHPAEGRRGPDDRGSGDLGARCDSTAGASSAS